MLDARILEACLVERIGDAQSPRELVDAFLALSDVKVETSIDQFLVEAVPCKINGKEIFALRFSRLSLLPNQNEYSVTSLRLDFKMSPVFNKYCPLGIKESGEGRPISIFSGNRKVLELSKNLVDEVIEQGDFLGYETRLESSPA